ncbi:hypothetical protein LNP74_21395 [Klebsiella pneumoniae subsp. pneumoniae]|nr:hypothetical protein [Klebsiella pneumoniae subsp. pneumoniae]
MKQQPFSGTYETQTHMTGNVDESLSTIYIMEMNLYRKTMLHTVCVTPVPFTKMYTLEAFASGNALVFGKARELSVILRQKAQ